MRRIERPRLAAEEPFGEITRTPQIEVAHLRPLNADDAKEMPRRNVERASLAWRHDRFANLRHACARILVERRVIGGQLVERVNDDRFGCATLVGIRRGLHPRGARHGMGAYSKAGRPAKAALASSHVVVGFISTGLAKSPGRVGGQAHEGFAVASPLELNEGSDATRGAEKV